MAGTALLPWDQWLARALHPLYVAIRRWPYKRQRQRELEASEGWPDVEGTVQSKQWDSSLPREELLYSYSTPTGYYAGAHWLWFERTEPREVRVGDPIVLRYRRDEPEKSVFVKLR